MTRGFFAGMTDYSHQSLDDIISDLEQLNDGVRSSIKKAKALLIKIMSSGYISKINPEFILIVSRAQKLLETVDSECKSISTELKTTVREDHVKRLNRIGEIADDLNKEIGIVWHQKYKDKEYGVKEFRAVEDLYNIIRDTIVDLLDLSNMASRLEDYVGKMPVNENSPEKKLIDFVNWDPSDETDKKELRKIGRQLTIGYLALSLTDIGEIIKDISEDLSVNFVFGSTVIRKDSIAFQKFEDLENRIGKNRFLDTMFLKFVATEGNTITSEINIYLGKQAGITNYATLNGPVEKVLSTYTYLQEYFKNYESNFRRILSRISNYVNPIIFLALVVYLPSLPTLSQRIYLTLFAVLLLVLLLILSEVNKRPLQIYNAQTHKYKFFQRNLDTMVSSGIIGVLILGLTVLLNILNERYFSWW